MTSVGRRACRGRLPRAGRNRWPGCRGPSGTRCGVNSTSAPRICSISGVWRWVQQPVGGEVLVDRAEVQRLLEPAPGARHARGGVDDDAGRLDQAGAQQRGQGQAGRRRVAPGGGDEGRPGQVVPEQLGQAVDGLAPAAPARACSSPYQLRVERGVLQPEVGRQVHDQPDPVPQRGDDPLGLAVRQGAEDQVEAVERVRVGSPRRPDRGRRRPSDGVCPPTASPACEWAVATATSKSGMRRPAGAAARPPCSPTPRRCPPSSHQYT